MALTIGSNPTSLFTQNTLSSNNQQLSNQLATGNRVSSAAVDPAAVAILSQYAAQLAGGQQSVSNLNDGISLTQVADGALSQVQNNTQQLETLAVQAGDPTLNAQDRQALQDQANQLSQSSQSILQNSQFNGVPLFQGGAQTYQAGPNANNTITVATPALTGAGGAGGLYGASGQINLTTQAGATQALDQVNSDLTTISSARASLGAASNGFSAAIGYQTQSNVDTAASSSAIGSTDYAAAVSQYAQTQIQSQAALAVQAQANVSSGQVLSLLKPL
jgi:flagellin